MNVMYNNGAKGYPAQKERKEPWTLRQSEKQ